MGSTFAIDLAGSDIGIRRSIEIHLSSNHYPPIPSSMVDPCIEAIDAGNAEDWDRLIDLPSPITWRGSDKAPAHAIIEAHHLSFWLMSGDDEE